MAVGRSSGSPEVAAAGPLPPHLMDRVVDLRPLTPGDPVRARFVGRWVGPGGAAGETVMIDQYPDPSPTRLTAWRLWKRADPTFVPELVYATRSNGCAYEVVRCGEHDTLRDLLQSARGPMPIETVSRYVEQLARAINHLHDDLGLVHGALTPDVITIVPGSPRRLRVGGLGSALTRRAAAAVRPTNSTSLWLQRMRGGEPVPIEIEPEADIRYLPPERARGEWRCEGDFWSLGVILMELLLGSCPFTVTAGEKGRFEFFQLIGTGHIDASDYLGTVPVSPRLLNLLNGLLTRDAAIRWDAAKVFDWLDGADPEVFRPVAPPDTTAARSAASAPVPGRVARFRGSNQVFISYSRKEKRYVARLARFLRAHGIRVWFDREVRAGDSWWPAIVEQLTHSRVVVVVMTPNADTSRWVHRELNEAEAQGKLIMPLLLDGHPFTRLSDIKFENVSDGRMPSGAFVARILAHLRGGR